MKKAWGRVTATAARLWRNGWLIAALSFLVVFLYLWFPQAFSFLWFPRVIEFTISENLAAQVVTLTGAILAITFSASLVVVQLASQHSHRMWTHFFDYKTKLYLALFVSASFLSFWFLFSPPNWNQYAFRISLTLAALVLSLLPPYLLSFEKKRDVSSVLDSLRRSAVKALESPSDLRLPEIRTVNNFAMTALNHKDLDTFGEAVDVLKELLVIAHLRDKSLAGRALAYRLSEIGSSAVRDTACSREVVNLLHNALEEIVSALERDVSDERKRSLIEGCRELVRTLGEIGLEAAEKHEESLVTEVVNRLGQAGSSTSPQIRASSMDLILLELSKIGVGAARLGEESAAWQTTLQLRFLGVYACEHSELGIARQVVDALGHIGVVSERKGLHDSVLGAAISLCVMGAWATLVGSPDLQTRTAKHLVPLGKPIIATALEFAPIQIAGSDPRLEQCLESFRKFNDQLSVANS